MSAPEIDTTAAQRAWEARFGADCTESDDDDDGD